MAGTSVFTAYILMLCSLRSGVILFLPLLVDCSDRKEDSRHHHGQRSLYGSLAGLGQRREGHFAVVDYGQVCRCGIRHDGHGDVIGVDGDGCAGAALFGFRAGASGASAVAASLPPLLPPPTYSEVRREGHIFNERFLLQIIGAVVLLISVSSDAPVVERVTAVGRCSDICVGSGRSYRSNRGDLAGLASRSKS